MNRATKNLIMQAIAEHNGLGKNRRDYNEIINKIYSFGFYTGEKLKDEYSADMTYKSNVYSLIDARTEKRINHNLIINESFNPAFEEIIGYEINAYIS